MISVRKLFLLCLMPFPLLSTEFLDYPIAICLFLILVIGTFLKKGYFLTVPLSLLTIYLLKTTFGMLYLPEPMITFLGLVSAHRILYTKTIDDKASRVIAFLWIASFSLLKTDLFYFFTMIYSISFIFITFDKKDDDKTHPLKFLKVKSIGSRETVICFILILVLFIFFPRFSNFFPKRNSTIQGKIGYSKSIDNSQIMNLQNSSQNAFTAETNQRLNPNDLYWRGRVHTKTDGFNWSSGNLKPSKTKIKLIKPVNYKIKYEQDLDLDIILLDTPYKIESSNMGYHRDSSRNMYQFYNKGRKATIEAVGSLKGYSEELTPKNKPFYLQLPGFIPKSLKKLIEDQKLESKNLKQTLASIKGYLIKEEFSYSLSPGDVTTLAKFLTKKAGYCTHYASFLGITLRYLGYQTRLISGFQGGIYNDLGGYYTVSSNDAHAWVEVLSNKRWLRIDPTSFIDPARINLGGQTYFNTSVEDRTFRKKSKDNFFSQLKDTWGFLNYKLSLYIDSYDITQQDKLSDYLKLTRKKFFIAGFLLMIFFILVYFLKPSGIRKNTLSEMDKLFNLFIKKHNKNSELILRADSIDTIRKKLSANSQSLEILTIFEDIKYAGHYSREKVLRIKVLVKDKKTYQSK